MDNFFQFFGTRTTNFRRRNVLIGKYWRTLTFFNGLRDWLTWVYENSLDAADSFQLKHWWNTKWFFAVCHFRYREVLLIVQDNSEENTKPSVGKVKNASKRGRQKPTGTSSRAALKGSESEEEEDEEITVVATTKSKKARNKSPPITLHWGGRPMLKTTWLVFVSSSLPPIASVILSHHQQSVLLISGSWSSFCCFW